MALVKTQAVLAALDAAANRLIAKSQADDATIQSLQDEVDSDDDAISAAIQSHVDALIAAASRPAQADPNTPTGG